MNEEIKLLHTIPNILIVDDVPANLKILGDILKLDGYKVRPVPSGKLALQVAEKEKPDLILLDIMMPEMDGFEVCRNLKAHETLSEIPIIFISALNDTSDIVNALKSGGVDFITKPFHSEEVSARVKTHLKLHLQSKLLQQQSKELQELIATKDKFFSIISHDLRGPLGGFMSYTEMMAEDCTNFSPCQMQEMTLEMSQSAKNIFSLLENLLEWSRMQQGHTAYKPQTVNLFSLTTDCIKTLTDSIRKKELQLEIKIAESHTVFADINMLQSIVRNLVGNAIKFTPTAGKITLSASLTENNTTVFIVKDSGIGMNQPLLSNLFKLAVNNSRPGTNGEQSSGLGLLLCKEFVEKHCGELWVESEEGKGSEFFFTLPDNPDCSSDLDNTGNSSEEITDQIKNLKILIAEDNELSENLIRMLTHAFSNRVFSVNTGSEAVEFCLDNPDLDLIFMDIKMPGLDGFEATRQIRRFNKEVIIIAQTAFGLRGDREKAKNAGCNDFLSKPVNKSDLHALMLKYFHR
jgi:CheY-like chemotaxis protein